MDLAKRSLQGLVLSLTCSAATLADPADVELTWSASGDSSTPLVFNPADFGDTIIGEDGSQQFVGSRTGASWQLGWTTTARQDAEQAFLDGTISIINLSDEAQDFSLQTALLLNTAIVDPRDVALSASLALTNLQWIGGASVTSAAGDSLITGLLDDTPVARVFDAPYVLSTSAPFGSASDTESSAALTTESINEQIAMLTSFTLSPGDLLNITYTLSVTAIPGPGVLPLLAVSILAGHSRRRRLRGRA